MELNSIDDVNALTEYQKLDKILRIEKKMNRLSFTPITSCAALMLYIFWVTWAGYTGWSPTIYTLIAVFIGSVGYSNVQRTDLLKQLFELKYGK
jgi:hypothetical protein